METVAAALGADQLHDIMLQRLGANGAGVVDGAGGHDASEEELIWERRAGIVGAIMVIGELG